jgi:hypothetical protein
MQPLGHERVWKAPVATYQSPAGRVATSDPAMDVARLAFLVGLGTASFDIFLAVQVGGFTLRAHQALLAIPFAYVMGMAFTQKRIRVPLGGIALLAWVVFILAFIPNTSFVARSAGYAAWLLLDVLIVVLAVQLFDDTKWLKVLLRWYVASFLVVSMVGLAQLVLGLCHLPAPFVRQWLIPGRWPRLNGFSYEPSYYATYLLMGWVFCACLIEQGSDFLSRKLVYTTFYASTLALVLSTSRMGWAMVGLWAGAYVFRSVPRWRTPRLSLGGWLIAMNLIGALVAGVGFVAAFKADRAVRFLAGGTGLFGTPAHSVNSRESRMAETLDLVRKNPFVGHSLGGVATAIGEARWEDVKSRNEAAKGQEGMSVFVEVLAASGVIGFVPFVVYILTLLIRPARLAARLGKPYSSVLGGLTWALAMELLILQFNQNVLRPYLWFHIGVLSAVYAALRDHLAQQQKLLSGA